MASVIAVIQISQQVGKALVDYYQSARDARKDIKDLYTSLGELEIVLESLAKLYKRPGQVQLPDSALILGPEGPLKRIKDDLETLNSKLEKKHHSFSTLVALKWPFEKKGVEKVVSNIEKGKGDLRMIVGIDNLDLSYKQIDILQELRSEIAQAQADATRQAIVSWLLSGVPNPSRDHNAARTRHQKGTGAWLTDSQDLKVWMESENSFMWLFSGGKSFSLLWEKLHQLIYDLAGAGKSILSSSVIDITERRCSTPLSVTIYWYFTFADHEKQKVLNMLLWFVANVLNERRDIPQRIHELYAQLNHGMSQPHLENVLEMFRVVVQDFDDIYIIMDGLDECPKTDSERARLLEIIKDIRNWNIPSMHIFVASRQERDILDEFENFASDDHLRIPADGKQVKNDIELFIQKRLSEDKRCSRWKPALKAFVQERISTRAGGMFRLAALQLEAITPIAIEARIRAAVEVLPRNLDMFYDRMLLEVDAENLVFVHRALQWLAFAGRSLRLYELAEAVIIDPDQPFSIDDRFMDCNSLLEMIPAGLVSSTPGTFTRYEDESVRIPSSELEFSSSCSTRPHNFDPHAPNSINDEDNGEDDSDGEELGFDEYTTCTIRLAHFSVKEYLVSDRIMKGPASMYSIDENLVDKAIAKCCFRYLMHIGDSRPQIHARLLYQFFLLYYSSNFLVHHLEKLEAQVRDPQVDDLMVEFFDTGKTDAWRVWVSVALRVFNIPKRSLPDNIYTTRWDRDSKQQYPWEIEQKILLHPITWLSSLGLTEALKQALPALPPMTLDSIPQIDDGFDRLGLPLFEASRIGCPKTLSVLLDAGADINTGLGTRRFALMVAIHHGSEFVKLFLNRGAIVNAKNCGLKWHDSPLRKACLHGYLEVVKLLLDSGADPNFVAKNNKYNDVPLAVAVARNSPDLTKMLLAYGANPNYVSNDDMLPTALQVAANFCKSVEMIRLLLEAGASPNLAPRGTSTPFHLVGCSVPKSPQASIEIMKLLLEYGADPYKRGESMRTPLISAVAGYCNNEVLEFLLGLKIDIHAVSNDGNALTMAIKSCYPINEPVRYRCPTTVIILLLAGAYQCADLHWQRAYNLARQLRDGPDGSVDDTSSENLFMYDSDIDDYESDTDRDNHMRDKEIIFDWMKAYDAKRNTEAVEKMEEIVSDVARLFTED
ncbi:P-loop containing nucleoside triphosphate hydrolase protein [Rutstroemia sp. NJR-2017a BVV2]|nr:P-loop containing nucleoside triphosphate hydrolase protein [Rutstroemia sp. NJR-2017a BVV2]